MKTCPQETTLSDFLAGLLAEERRGEVLAHVEHCADCQWVLAAGDGAQAPSSPSPPLAPGATVSRYVVRERLGSGAMGVVYPADDPELGRRVALKVLRPEGHQRQELQQRLLREAQSLARLSHSNVVTLYDVGTYGDGILARSRRPRRSGSEERGPLAPGNRVRSSCPTLRASAVHSDSRALAGFACRRLQARPVSTVGSPVARRAHSRMRFDARLCRRVGRGRGSGPP